MKISSKFESRLIDNINITPMVDVFLVLLIIFMITASMINNKILKVDLPESSQAEDMEVMDFIQIEVNKNNAISFNGKRIKNLDDLKPLIQRMVKRKPDIPINIQADKNVSVQNVVLIIDAAKSAKAKSVTIQTSE